MKTQTSELTGAALDWAVAKCERPDWDATILTMNVLNGGFNPSINWSQGGVIIERERLSVLPYSFNTENPWVSHSAEGCRTEVGPTPLITAMRCYVASKLGDEVDIPNELINEGEIK